MVLVEIDIEKFLKMLNELSEEERKKILEKMNKATIKHRDKVMEEVFKRGIMSKKEYKEKYENKYIDENYGGDSFPQLMEVVLHGKDIMFVTVNEKMLRDREKLEKRFGVRILSPNEAIEILQKENTLGFGM